MYVLINTLVDVSMENHTMLFLIFAITNIFDWITGWVKSRVNKTENSKDGFLGAIKKIGNWVIVFISFLLSESFIEFGNIIDMNFEIASFLGWFVLITLIVNEVRSILENLVECNVHVPSVLVKGLEKFNNRIKEIEDDKKTN